MTDVLVVSNCSSEKLYEDSSIGCEEIDTTSQEELLERYPGFSAPASNMYTGVEHPYVKSAVANLRELSDVSWKIVSAGYGLLDETDEIMAYDCSTSNIRDVQDRAERMGYDLCERTQRETRQAVAREIGISSCLRKALGPKYDLVFLTLSTPYLIAISEELNDLPGRPNVFAIASNSAKPYVGEANWIPATDEVRAELGSNWHRLRGRDT